MFEKDITLYFGDVVNGVAGPQCQDREDHPFIGSDECINCKYCYGGVRRFYDSEDNATGLSWKNGRYDGYILCASYNNCFIAKIKNHIFKLRNKKIREKKL